MGPSVTFGDDSQGQTEGYGVLSNGPLTFRRVAYVSGLKHNLISVSQICDAGYEAKRTTLLLLCMAITMNMFGIWIVAAPDII